MREGLKEMKWVDVEGTKLLISEKCIQNQSQDGWPTGQETNPGPFKYDEKV